MKKFLKLSGAAAFAALALAFSGCEVDPAYTLENLKNIDKDVHLFQNGFQLRLADSSSVFRVDSLMKTVGLDTSGLIKQAPDGSYYIEYSQTMDLDDEIDGIGLSNVVTINALSFSENIAYELEGFDLADLLATVPPEMLDSYTIPDVHYDVDKKVEFDFMSGSDLPEMLVGVGEIVLNEVYANVELLFTDLPGDANQEYALDATATLPSFCVPQVIELKGNIKRNQAFVRSAQIVKFDLSNKDFVAMRTNGTNLSDSVVIHGSVSATDVVVDLNNVTPYVNGSVDVSIADAQGKVDIQSLKVKVDYQLEQSFKSPFFSLPDAFNDATIELPNASVDLSVRTNMAFPVSGTADLYSVGAAQPAATLNFTVPYCLSPAQYEESNSHNDVNLNSLLAEATDSIEFVTHIATDKTTDCYIEPAADYGFQIGFSLNVPLALGAGTLINYADTISIGADTGKQIGQILKSSSIGLRASVYNSIPVSADLTVEFLHHDEESGVYTPIPMTAPVVAQLPGPGSTGLLEIVIGADKDNDALEGITDLRLSIALHANGQALKGSDFIVLTDIYLLLPQGIHFDGNVLFDNSGEEGEDDNQ